MRRRRGRERACVIRRDTQTRESESCVEAHQRRKKPDLLSPKNQLQMFAHRFSLCPQLYTHAKVYSASEFCYPNTHIYIGLQFTYLCMHLRISMHNCFCITCRWNKPGFTPPSLSLPLMDNKDFCKKQKCSHVSNNIAPERVLCSRFFPAACCSTTSVMMYYFKSLV